MADNERLIPPGILSDPSIEGISGQITHLVQLTQEGAAQQQEIDRLADAHKMELAELKAKFAEDTDVKRIAQTGINEHMTNLAHQIASTILAHHNEQPDTEEDVVYVASLMHSLRVGSLDFGGAEGWLNRFRELQPGTPLLVATYDGDSLEEATGISFSDGGTLQQTPSVIIPDSFVEFTERGFGVKLSCDIDGETTKINWPPTDRQNKIVVGQEEVDLAAQKWLEVQNSPHSIQCLDSLAVLVKLPSISPKLEEFRNKALALMNIRLEADGRVPFNYFSALYRLDKNLYDKAFRAFAQIFEADQENPELHDFVEAVLLAENPDYYTWGVNKKFMEQNKTRAKIAEIRIAAKPDSRRRW